MLTIIEKKIHGVLSTQRALCKWHLSLRHHSYGRRVYGEWVAPGAERPAFRRQMSDQCKEAFLTVPVAAASCRRGVVTEGVWRNPFSGVLEKVPAYGRTGSDQNWATSHVTWELMKKLLDPGQETLIQKAGECVSLTLCEGFCWAASLGTPRLETPKGISWLREGRGILAHTSSPVSSSWAAPRKRAPIPPRTPPVLTQKEFPFKGPTMALKSGCWSRADTALMRDCRPVSVPKWLDGNLLMRGGPSMKGVWPSSLTCLLRPSLVTTVMLARQHRADEFRLFTCALWSLA